MDVNKFLVIMVTKPKSSSTEEPENSSVSASSETPAAETQVRSNAHPEISIG